MPEEFVCPECAYSSDKREKCPFCEVGLIKIDEGIEQFSYGDENTNDSFSSFESDHEVDMGELPNAI